MSAREGFWRNDKNDKELRNEIDEGVEEVFGSVAQDSGLEEKKVPSGLIDAVWFFHKNGEEKAREIFDWYEKAITRRNREALGLGSFLYHFFGEGSSEKNYLFGDDHDGYVLGVVRHGVFIPSHFAPRSLRGGYRLIKDLGESQEIPAVLAITDDLAETIKRIPSWHNLGISFPARFRGEVHNKQLVYNSHPNIERILPILAEDYLAEENRSDVNYTNDYEEEMVG